VTKKKRDTPLAARVDASAVLDVVRKAGYPLELRLYRSLNEDNQVSVQYNPVLKHPDGGVREVDLVANVHSAHGHSAHGFASVRVAIEAKGLPDDAAFVGFCADDAATASPDIALRCVVAGYPSFGVIPETLGPEALDGSRLLSAFAALAEAPSQCVQWCVARQARAEHEQAFHNAFDALVLTSHTFALRYSHAAYKRAAQSPKARLQALSIQHALVVRNDSLFRYDVGNDTVVKTGWLTLRRQFDMGDYSDQRLIDVFEERELPEMLGRYKQTAESLREAVRADEAILRGVGEADLEDVMNRIADRLRLRR
jgi:hypothetical protein